MRMMSEPSLATSVLVTPMENPMAIRKMGNHFFLLVTFCHFFPLITYTIPIVWFESLY